MREFDLVVIGAGVAGLTAATHAARAGLSVAVIERMGVGGQIAAAERIENFPGFPQGVTGAELGPLLHEQAEAAGAEFVLDTVDGIAVEGDWRVVNAASEPLKARAVIVAAGSRLRSLGVPGEEAFLGRGVSHCASCDGHFFSGQDVCVIGGGDSALDEALVLTEHAARVTIIHREEQFDAQRVLIDRVAANGKIEIVPKTAVEEIFGDDSVSGVRLRDLTSRAVRDHAVKGVFVYVGLEPNTAFLRGTVALDPAGHIETDIMMRTSVPGIFAAGDIRAHSVAQLAAVAGDGATAAIAAWRYLKERAPDGTQQCRPVLGEPRPQTYNCAKSARRIRPMNKPTTPPELSNSAAFDDKITVLNPVGYPPKINKKALSPRPESLDGKTIYLVDCRFDDSIDLLKQIQAWFGDHMPSVKTKMISLSATYQHDDKKTWEEIKANGDAAIVGVGHCSNCAPAVATHAITIETKYGVPTVALHTDKFDRVVQSVTKMAGLPEAQRAFVPMPVMGKTAAELREYVYGKDPITGKPVMQEVIAGLTTALNG